LVVTAVALLWPLMCSALLCSSVNEPLRTYIARNQN